MPWSIYARYDPTVWSLLVPEKFEEMPMLKKLLPLAAAAFLSACTTAPAPTTGAQDIYQRSAHEIAQPPQAAAACIARNAAALGYHASLSPLYGTAVMAVVVSTLKAGGDTVATVQLLPEGGGSHAQATSTTETLAERPDVIRSLLNGC